MITTEMQKDSIASDFNGIKKYQDKKIKNESMKPLKYCHVYKVIKYNEIYASKLEEGYDITKK